MNQIRCIAIDDEPLALTILNDYVSKVSYLNMTKTYTCAADATQYIQTEKPEILFLDVQMPEIKGIDFIKTLVYKPVIILTTAYAEYAIQGYDLDVIDYLLKPIPFERFLQAVNKAMRLIESDKKLKNIDEKEYLFVKSGFKSVKINFQDILYIEGLKEYVGIYTKNERYLKLDSLKKLEKILPEDKFIRTHKSYIVNIDFIKSHFGNVIEISDKEIPIGRVYRDKLNKLFR